MNRTYLDSSAIIYLIEGLEPFHSSVVRKLSAQQTSPEDQVLTSRISMLECRVMPLKRNDPLLLQMYDDFFSKDCMPICEVTSSIIDQATHLRAKYNVKTPDALHLASAIEHSATLFITGDAKLKRCTELQVDVLS